MQKPSEETMRRVAENMSAFILYTTAGVATTGGFIGSPVSAFSDDDLEYWGNFFVENRLHARGILFETFMLNPFEISQAVLFRGRLRDPEDFLPLLPRQRDVARQVHPHVPAISKPLSTLKSADLCHWPVDDALDLPIFLRRQAD